MILLRILGQALDAAKREIEGSVRTMADHRASQPGEKFATKLIHFGAEIDEHTGASSVPVYQASTFHHHDIFNPPDYDYTRSGNPTRQALEDYITLLEGGVRGFAFASGMAAISTAFLLLSAGDHVIVTEDVYGGTYRLLTTILNRLGIESTFVDMTDFEAVKAALQSNTKAVFMETPSNPTLKITDIGEIAEWAKSLDLITMLDNTFMTPYHQRPIELGVDIVLHSATKFLGGHSDVLAGLAVVATESLGRRLKQLQNGIGSVLGAQESWLLIRGMKTLQASMEHSERSARKLAEWLDKRSDIDRCTIPACLTILGVIFTRSSLAATELSFPLILVMAIVPKRF